MNTNILRSRFEKPLAAATLTVLGAVGISACSAEAASHIDTVVCSGEQAITPDNGETFTELVVSHVGGDALKALGSTQLTKAIESNQNSIGEDFTINSATKYDVPPILTQASVAEKAPQTCNVVEVAGR